MSKFYAQIDANNIVEGVSQTHSEIIAPHMIELPFYDLSKLGNLYNPIDGSFTPQDVPIRTITTQAFYRRLALNERKALRTGTSDEIADFREDLQRSPFVDLDGTIEAQLLSVGTQQPRVDQLLVNGTEEETKTG